MYEEILVPQQRKISQDPRQLFGGKVKDKNTLVSGNAGDKKNFQPGGHKFVFLTNSIQFFK